jgi:sulfite exporter TauE/SafE
VTGDLTLAAAFVAGVSGSLHCLSMCGGLASAFGMRARAVSGHAQSAFVHASLYQLGRLTSYALVGALCGLFGGLLLGMIDMAKATRWLRVAAGCLLILLGLQLAFGWRLLSPIEKFGAYFWRQLSPLTRQLTGTGVAHSFAIGMLWGWLPCGLVYSMLLLGVLGGTASHGALLMLTFGVGTLPSMLSSSLLASQLTRVLTLRGWRWLAASAMIAFGLWTAVVPLQGHAH